MRPLVRAVALIAAGPALAQEANPHFCPNRPSLGTSTCVTDPGRVLVEVGGIDWQRDTEAGDREDQVIAGDLVARVGLSRSTEALIGWTAYGHVRDRSGSGTTSASGAGDVTLGLRRNLRSPDGSGLSVAIQPFVTLPTGRAPIGAGDYALGVVLPVTYDLTDTLNLAFTAEVDDAADKTRDGHHLEYSGVLGLGYSLSEHLTAVGELSLAREDDPDGRHTTALAAGSVAWQPRTGLQLDLLAVAGLNRDAPDLRLALGGAVLF